MFLSYFVGMCGDGANDCGVSIIFVIYSSFSSLSQHSQNLTSFLFQTFRLWRGHMEAFPYQSSRLQWHLLLPPKLLVFPVCQTLSGSAYWEISHYLFVVCSNNIGKNFDRKEYEFVFIVYLYIWSVTYSYWMLMFIC